MDQLSQARDCLKRIAILANQRTQSGMSSEQLFILIHAVAAQQAEAIEHFQIQMKAAGNSNGQERGTRDR